MIDPKRLTEADKGREVVYTDGVGDREYGFISSWSDKYVFVRYSRGDTAASTRPEDLDFTLGGYSE